MEEVLCLSLPPPSLETTSKLMQVVQAWSEIPIQKELVQVVRAVLLVVVLVLLWKWLFG